MNQVDDTGLFPAFDSCPGCGGDLRVIQTRDLTDFICDHCGTAWHLELGEVYRVPLPARPDPS